MCFFSSTLIVLFGEQSFSRVHIPDFTFHWCLFSFHANHDVCSLLSERYPLSRDHLSVHSRPPAKTFRGHAYWLDHNEPEERGRGRSRFRVVGPVPGSFSVEWSPEYSRFSFSHCSLKMLLFLLGRKNEFEAQMALSLARHMMLQGYSQDDITIICACECRSQSVMLRHIVSTVHRAHHHPFRMLLLSSCH